MASMRVLATGVTAALCAGAAFAGRRSRPGRDLEARRREACRRPSRRGERVRPGVPDTELWHSGRHVDGGRRKAGGPRLPRTRRVAERTEGAARRRPHPQFPEARDVRHGWRHVWRGCRQPDRVLLPGPSAGPRRRGLLHGLEGVDWRAFRCPPRSARPWSMTAPCVDDQYSALQYLTPYSPAPTPWNRRRRVPADMEERNSCLFRSPTYPGTFST
jgi:hypothetical protein